MSDSSLRGSDHPSRLARAAAVCGAGGKLCPAERATQLLEAIIEPGDRVAIEGDNQKQADFLASTLANVDPARPGWILLTPDRKAAGSPNSSRRTLSRSAQFTPISNSTPACWWT